MAAYTVNNNDSSRSIRFLEAVTITNQTAASTTVTKAVRIPQWARHAIFNVFYDSAGGTTPTFDFVLGIPDFGSAARLIAPTDDNVSLLGNDLWNGITQLTGAGPYLIQIDVGPDVAAAQDDTGSATADSFYSMRQELPPWLTYSYTTTDAADDADYAFRIVLVLKAG